MNETKVKPLLPCPWCGQDPEIANLDSLGKRWLARCTGDDCQTIRLSQDGSREGAIAAWNTRAPSEAAVRREALEEAASICDRRGSQFAALRARAALLEGTTHD